MHKMQVQLGIKGMQHFIKLKVAHYGIAPRCVFRIDQLLHALNNGMLFIKRAILRKLVIAVYPKGYAGKPGVSVNGNGSRTVKQLGRIKNIVYFFLRNMIFHKYIFY